MYLAAGLGQIREKATGFTVPSVSDIAVSDEDEVLVNLESTALLSGLHPTLPIQTLQAQKLMYLQNGFDRERKYNGGSNIRDAFVLAPAQAPTVESQTATSTLGAPVDVVIYGDYMYVTDAAGHRIIKLNRDGEYVAEFNRSSASLPAGITHKLDEPMGMCEDGTYLYVCDSKNDRVLVFQLSDFTYSSTFGSTGTGNGNFDTPLDICHDGTYLYVTDSENDRISIWTKATTTWNSHYGSTGSGTDQFNTPKGIVCDTATPCLWIADSLNNRLVISDKATVMGGATWTTVSSGSGYSILVPTGLGNDDSFTYVYLGVGAEIQRWETNGASAPTFKSKLGSWGTGDDQYKGTPFGISCTGGAVWVADNHWGFGDDGRLKSIDPIELDYQEEILQTVDYSSFGEREYCYTYVDEDGVESARSPVAGGVHPPNTVDLDVDGFHSADPKVAYIKLYGTYFDAFGDFYLIEKFANNPAGTTWTKTDDTDDTDLGGALPSLEKRLAIQGVPPTRRVSCIWRDMMWRAGGVHQPDYSAGTVNFAASWDASRGLWKGTITNGVVHDSWVGRYIAEQSAPDDKYQIVAVDTDNNYVWLSVEFEGTTASEVAYTVTDERDFSIIEYSQPGYHEDVPAGRFLAIGEGDGDEVVALYPMGERLFAFKRHSVWVVTGTGPSSFVVRRVTQSTGAQSPHSLVELPLPGSNPILAFWSYPTVYAMSPTGSEPQAMSSFMDPLTANVSEGASPRCVALFDRQREVVTFSMGTDDDPANHDNFTLETYGLRWSRDVGLRISAAGELRNRFGKYVPFSVDEFGCLRQHGIGATEGNPSNDLSGDVTAYDAQTLKISCSGATFDTDLEGCPAFIIDALGEMRRVPIVASALHDIYLAWDPSSTPDTDCSIMIAGIECVLETGEIDGDMAEIEKKYEDLWVDYQVGAATLRVDVAADEDDWELADEFDLDEDAPEHVPLSGASIGIRGSGVRFKFSTMAPGEAWALRSYSFRMSYRSERSR